MTTYGHTVERSLTCGLITTDRSTASDQVTEYPTPIGQVAEHPTTIEQVTEHPTAIEQGTERATTIEQMTERSATIAQGTEHPTTLEQVTEHPATIEQVTEHEPSSYEVFTWYFAVVILNTGHILPAFCKSTYVHVHMRTDMTVTASLTIKTMLYYFVNL